MNFFSEETAKQLNAATEHPSDNFVEFRVTDVIKEIPPIIWILLALAIAVLILRFIKGLKNLFK